MKKFLLSFLLILSFVVLTTSEIFSQWVPQTSGITTRLRYVHAVNDNIVWACGNSGVVLKTTDGGTTWAAVTPPNAGSTMYNVSAFDATTAWVTGTVGGSADVSIWKTTDGGTSWTSQYNNPTGFGDGVKMFDANNGVYYGDPDPVGSSDWEILTTSNGGANWNRVPVGNYPPADGTNGEVGVACNLFTLGNTAWFSSYTSTGTIDFIYKSTNQGLNWTRSSFQAILGGSSFISFADQNNGLVVCLDNATARTTDGGTTWTTSSLAGVGFRSIVYVPAYGAYLTVGSSGVSNYTRDNGVTWTPLTTGTTNTLYWVATSGNYCWAVGNSGTILKMDGSVLPVELASFTAVSQNQQVTLNWITASEINNNGFEIQRSVDNSNFVTVGFVKGAGTTTIKQEYSFTDKNLSNGTYSYRLKQIDFNGSYEFSNVVEVDVRSLDNYILEQNYPNPFNPTTNIGYILKEKTNVRVVVMNSIGEEIAVLVNQTQEQGYHQLEFNASNLPSGIYFYSLQAGKFTETKKMLLLK